MEFYCPVCQQVVVQTAEKIVTTKLNQKVALAKCPVCGQEVSHYGVTEETGISSNV